MCNKGRVFETLDQSCIADKQENWEQSLWKARLLFKNPCYSYLQESIFDHSVGAGLGYVTQSNLLVGG